MSHTKVNANNRENNVDVYGNSPYHLLNLSVLFFKKIKTIFKKGILTPNAKSPSSLSLSGQQQASFVHFWHLNLILPPENCSYAYCLTWCSNVSILSLLTDILDMHCSGPNLSFLVLFSTSHHSPLVNTLESGCVLTPP